MKYYFPYNEDNESKFNIPGMFFVGPGGISNLSRLFHKSNDLLCTIFNGEYGIFLIDKIETNDECRFLLECSKMPNYNDVSSITIYDAYDYLEKSHFLNFLISRTFKKCIWASEGIDMNIQIVNTDNEKYSKIIIIIETSNIPDYIYEDILLDTFKEKDVKMESKIYDSPMMIKVLKNKSYYKPILTYDMTFGFNKYSTINFHSIHLCNFYNQVLIDYINDALATFYLGISSNYIEIYKEKLLRVQFIVDESEKMLNVKMICVPAFIMSTEFEIAGKYNYVNEGLYLLENVDFGYAINKHNISFVNSISSSEVSQLIVLSTKESGIINEYLEDYTTIDFSSLIFTINREVMRFSKMKTLSKPPKIFINIDEIPSDTEYVSSYWKPTSPIIVDTSEKSEDCQNTVYMQIYGFINIRRNSLSKMKYFSDIYDDIHQELEMIYDFNEKDYKSGNFSICRCYDSPNTSRFMIFKFIDKELPKNNKFKNFRVWRSKN